jgi:hypothetical protein
MAGIATSTSTNIIGIAVPRKCLNLCGAGKRNRTPDLRITNALLYRLSYSGTLPTMPPSPIKPFEALIRKKRDYSDVFLPWEGVDCILPNSQMYRCAIAVPQHLTSQMPRLPRFKGAARSNRPPHSIPDLSICLFFALPDKVILALRARFDPDK